MEKKITIPDQMWNEIVETWREHSSHATLNEYLLDQISIGTGLIRDTVLDNQLASLKAMKQCLKENNL